MWVEQALCNRIRVSEKGTTRERRENVIKIEDVIKEYPGMERLAEREG